MMVIAMGKAGVGFNSSGGGRGIFFWPTTTAGRLSVGLIVAFVVLIVAKFMVFAIALCCLAAVVCGFIAVLGMHERSLFVWLPLAVGVIIALFLLAELLFPH